MKVLISTSSFAVHDRRPLDLLERHGIDYTLNPYGRTLKPSEVAELAEDHIGIIAGTEELSRAILLQLPSLKVISRVGVGIDNVDLDTCKQLNIRVRNTPNSVTQAVAELTVGFIIDISRGISLMSQQMHSGIWDKKMGNLVSGKTVGIVGLGRIGKRVAQLLKPFSVEIIAFDPFPDREWARANDIRFVQVDELMQLSDIVTIHVPYSKENHNFIDMTKLKMMKKNAYIINTARGGLIDELALYNCLKNGDVRGACIDVYNDEPYNGPLNELDNVILTPHIGSYAVESRIEMELEAANNFIESLEESL
jgi:D-3-phosphoglycerate dehydrogenase